MFPLVPAKADQSGAVGYWGGCDSCLICFGSEDELDLGTDMTANWNPGSWYIDPSTGAVAWKARRAGFRELKVKRLELHAVAEL